jgi:F-box and WD-40 domain protein 5
VPIVLTEILTEHSHQVLHVSFSNNGKMFATTSKDAYVKVWKSDHPAKLKYEFDMKALSWQYTQFSQFNSTDTLLLVSGIHFGTINATSGEIAVFSLVDDFQLRCRVQNKPYDIFGCFYNENFVLSGDLRWLAHLISKSTIVLNRASQEIASERTQVTKNLYNFYNRNASSVRNLM